MNATLVVLWMQQAALITLWLTFMLVHWDWYWICLYQTCTIDGANSVQLNRALQCGKERRYGLSGILSAIRFLRHRVLYTYVWQDTIGKITRACLALNPCYFRRSSVETGIKHKTFAITLHFWKQPRCNYFFSVITHVFILLNLYIL